MQYDGPLEIATGRSRVETNWKNKKTTWAQLVKKLSETHRTAETYSDYLLAKKARQDEIKDVGGFVGGFLTGGRRNKTSVLHRQLITLDIDHGTGPHFWDDFQMQYGNAAVLYSTHKHAPETPRLRLIIPLDREVQTDEYVAIARRIAGTLGIDDFDDTTFEPSRLMYWPSTSIDGEFIHQAQDGPWLSADAVLATYRDWKDASEWPISSRVNEVITRGIKKQGDPLEKKGLIGAFCRTYTITEAIETYLGDAYEATDVPGRFTYKEGSTAAGLVIYDNKYAYSHHGTDPVSGKLCNAYDLVRIHKFELLDEDSDKPSNDAMKALAAADPAVIGQLGIERIAEAESDFQVETDDPENNSAGEADQEWLKDLAVDGKGNYTSSIDNIYLLLKNHKRLKGAFAFDEFEGCLTVLRNLPWRKVTRQSRDFTEDDAACLAHFLEKYKIPFVHLDKALAKIKIDYKTHPVRDFITGLPAWDGVERLDTLFVDYLGAQDTEYVRVVTRKTLVAAIARVFEPGIKFDTILTLIGKEGTGKSTILAKLAGNWFSDCLGNIHTKEGMESLRAVWIMEIAELSGFRKADEEAIKRFASSREDIYRPSYGKQQVRFPRQCVFFATTNKVNFLKGSHGNRRFLPVLTGEREVFKSVFTDFGPGVIAQVWAEAYFCYRNGESLDLSDAVKLIAEEVREDHNEVDDRAGLIETYLDTLVPDNWEDMDIFARRAHLQSPDELNPGTFQRNEICVAEIWCEALGGMQKDLSFNNTKYIHDIMRLNKKWEKGSSFRFRIYGTQRVYKRKLPRLQKKSKNVNT